LTSDRTIAAAQVLLSVVFIGCYFAMLAAFMAGYVRVPENYKDAFTALLGVLTAGVGQILAFWYSRSRPAG
jgi:uncharacterized YccA/Bax inhibitor family protein